MPENEKMDAPDAPENGQGPEDLRIRLPSGVVAAMLSKMAGLDIEGLKSRLANQVRDTLVGTVCDSIQDEVFDHMSTPLILGVCSRMAAFNMAQAAKPGHEDALFELQISKMREDYASACTFFAAQRAADAADDAEDAAQPENDEPPNDPPSVDDAVETKAAE